VALRVERSQRETFVKINGVRCHVRYGNLNQKGDWWFGFLPADMVSAKDCQYAFLVCGLPNDFVEIYMVPFGELASFLRQGVVVPGSEELHAFIPPGIGNRMKVTGNTATEIPMAPHKIYRGRVGPKLAEVVADKLQAGIAA